MVPGKRTGFFHLSFRCKGSIFLYVGTKYFLGKTRFLGDVDGVEDEDINYTSLFAAEEVFSVTKYFLGKCFIF